MWKEIKEWYIRNGFTHAAENMKEIKQNWSQPVGTYSSHGLYNRLVVSPLGK